MLSQTRRCDEIIVAPGPRSDRGALEKLRGIGVKVAEAVDRIGLARVRAALSTDADIVVSCDSDSIYDEHYVEEAVKTLESGFKAVKAGHIEPLKWSIGAALELPLATILPYEFGLAFWRKDFMKTRAVRLAQEIDNRMWDIGPVIAVEMQPIAINPRMKVKTRLPTHAVKSLAYQWLPQAIATAIPIAIAAGATATSEMYRTYKKRFMRPSHVHA